MEKLLEELKKMDITSREWDEKLEELKQEVEHHVKEEEGSVFDRMKTKISEEEEKSLSKEFYEQKKQEMEKIK